MKNSTKNVIALLEKQLKNTRAVANIFAEKGDQVTAKRYIGEASGIQQAIWLLTNQEYFDKQSKVFEDYE